MTNIHDKIKNEYEAMLQAIFPSERRQHALKLAELERERDQAIDIAWGEYTALREAREDGE